MSDRQRDPADSSSQIKLQSFITPIKSTRVDVHKIIQDCPNVSIHKNISEVNRGMYLNDILYLDSATQKADTVFEISV